MKKLQESILDIFKTRKLKLAGVIFTWIIPLIFLIWEGAKSNVVKSISFELWAIPCLGVVLIIYYKKLKQVLHDKLLINGARGIPLGPVYYLITTIVNLATLYCVYAVFKVISAMNTNINTFLTICMTCVALGGMCYIADSINHLGSSNNGH